ncbi:HIT family protein [Pontibacter sp. G13]|uniref:HIT family protein n=1 Tax=Pontibacter sp. G13 TaxID=3074898 RepID=UPI002889D6ED|nr:HIT family protein [Pontibacter sp. G13]WNJ20154.1 HIT family protein [Pontibacter sp. G13]
MASIFTKIVKGEIPCYKVAETDDFLAFLDIRPLAKGHTLVIPKLEVDYIFDLPEPIYIGLHVFAKEVASAIEKTVPCKRIGTAVVGLEVPHAHLHLVPINEVGDLSFAKPPVSIPENEMKELAAEIQRNLA